MSCDTPEYKVLSSNRVQLEELVNIQLQKIAVRLRGLDILDDSCLSQITAKNLLGIILTYVNTSESKVFECFLQVLEEEGTQPLKQFVNETIKVQCKQYYRDLFPSPSGKLIYFMNLHHPNQWHVNSLYIPSSIFLY